MQAQAVAEADGLTKIKALQQHDTESICSQAVKVLEAYFGAEFAKTDDLCAASAGPRPHGRGEGAPRGRGGREPGGRGRKHPIYLSSLYGRADAAGGLLAAGASVDLADKDGVTPLFMAAQE